MRGSLRQSRRPQQQHPQPHYSHARTQNSDGSPVTWPWQLNNLHTVISPFYPCSYRCEHALAYARASLSQLALSYPECASALRLYLSLPVLYFDHEHQLILDGAPDPSNPRHVHYRALYTLESASPELASFAAALSHGDSLLLDDQTLKVQRGPDRLITLPRTDPALGLIAPFGAQAID